MAKNIEQKPLIDITPERLAELKQHYILGTGNSMCKVYCHLIDSIAADRGWDLDVVEWKHEDGSIYKGLQQIKEASEPATLAELRERNENRLTEVHSFRQKGFLAVISQNYKGTYVCLEYAKKYRQNEGNWTAVTSRNNATANEAFKWLEIVIEREKGRIR